MERFIYILNIALEAVFINKFRSMLTALGIIFGVAAVIAMMAIGTGAKQEILEQMKVVGVNNIIITPKIEKKGQESQDGEHSQSKKDQKKYSPGLTLKDVRNIREVIPTIFRTSPEVVYETDIIADGIQRKAKISGVSTDFFEIFGLQLQEGEMFNNEQLRDGKAVCIIGPKIKSKFFPSEKPIGKYIKCGQVWLKIIGVLESRNVSQNTTENLGISDYNNTIFAPIQTIFIRFKDRSVVTSSMLQGGGGVYYGGDFSVSYSSGSGDESNNHNQIDKIIVQVKESEQIKHTSEIIKRILTRRHAGSEDFEIKVPELLLKQEQRTKDIFNIVLAAIAGISLLVGGIGIMNIMLASVLERIKEIGIRQAIGATKRDIVMQFLTEATIISISGGLIGIILGIVIAKVIMKVTGILTIISPVSIIISFIVSASVGILFGFMPARKASRQDPVTSLRHE